MKLMYLRPKAVVYERVLYFKRIIKFATSEVWIIIRINEMKLFSAITCHMLRYNEIQCNLNFQNLSGPKKSKKVWVVSLSNVHS